MIITIAVPAAHVSDANNLAMVLGYGPPDEQTYGEPVWQDADGNLYSVTSLTAVPVFVTNALSPLERPEWDVEPYRVNMAAANRAQALVTFWQASEEAPEPPQAAPDRIVAVAGTEGLAAVAAMGLTRIEAKL